MNKLKEKNIKLLYKKTENITNILFWFNVIVVSLYFYLLIKEKLWN